MRDCTDIFPLVSNNLELLHLLPKEGKKSPIWVREVELGQTPTESLRSSFYGLELNK